MIWIEFEIIKINIMKSRPNENAGAGRECSLDGLRGPALLELLDVGIEQGLLLGVPDEVRVVHVDPVDVVLELLERTTITDVPTSLDLEAVDRVGNATGVLLGRLEVTIAERDVGQGVDDTATNIVLGLTSGTRVGHKKNLLDDCDCLYVRD